VGWSIPPFGTLKPLRVPRRPGLDSGAPIPLTSAPGKLNLLWECFSALDITLPLHFLHFLPVWSGLIDEILVNCFGGVSKIKHISLWSSECTNNSREQLGSVPEWSRWSSRYGSTGSSHLFGSGRSPPFPALQSFPSRSDARLRCAGVYSKPLYVCLGITTHLGRPSVLYL
jgi:hypothetical protein